jgi:hypothetical protein
MIYVKRNKEGKIIALHRHSGGKLKEKKDVTDEEVIDFLNEDGDVDGYTNLLSLSDLAIIRIVEDLIDLLIRKNLFQFTELPEDAQHKLIQRKQLRDKMISKSILIDDEDIL